MFLLQNDLHINAYFLLVELVELVEQILIGCEWATYCTLYK